MPDEVRYQKVEITGSRKRFSPIEGVVSIMDYDKFKRRLLETKARLEHAIREIEEHNSSASHVTTEKVLDRMKRYI